MDVELSTTKILYLENFHYCIFYGYILLTQVYHIMLGQEILKYFYPILDKNNPPEDKELPNPSGSLSKVTYTIVVKCQL